MVETKFDIEEILLGKLTAMNFMFGAGLSLFIMYMIQGYLEKQIIDIGYGISLLLIITIPIMVIFMLQNASRRLQIAGYAGKAGIGIPLSGIALIIVLIILMWMINTGGFGITFSVAEPAFELMGIMP